jgi:hypothetical protein
MGRSWAEFPRPIIGLFSAAIPGFGRREHLRDRLGRRVLPDLLARLRSACLLPQPSLLPRSVSEAVTTKLFFGNGGAGALL